MTSNKMYKLTESNKHLVVSKFITPLFREIINVPKPGDFVPIPKQNYNRYNLFVLRTRLRALLNKVWLRDDVDVEISTVAYSGKMHIKVLPLNGSYKSTLNPRQRNQFGKMLLITLKDPLDYCVVFSEKDLVFGETRIPKSWVMSVLPYLKIPLEHKSNIYIKSRIGKYGYELLCYGAPNELSDEHNNDNYALYYNFVQEELGNLMLKWYLAGRIVIVSESTRGVREWKLRKVEGDLYKPMWRDGRITKSYGGMYNFILSRILNETDIKLYVGNNLVDYHLIAKGVKTLGIDTYFGNHHIHLSVSDLKQAQNITDLVDDVDSFGVRKKVAIFKISKPHVSTYVTTLHNLDLKDFTFYYKVDLLGYSYYLSVLLAPDVNEQIIINEIKNLVLKAIN